MRIAFFGSGEFGVPTLRRLREAHEVVLVVTQPDRPAGRRRQLSPTPVGVEASGAALPLFKPEAPNDPDAIARVHETGPDALVVIAYGHKISPALIDEIFAINLHASLLPKYRGAAPINWAMINGETETGLSVITLSQRMDGGHVLGQVETPIDPRETADELESRLAALGPDLVTRVLSDHREGRLRPVPQDDALASRAPKLSKADGTVSFDQPARHVRQRIHGLTPWPGCTVSLGREPLRLCRVEEIEESAPAAAPGTLLDDGTVACAPGRIRLLEVRPAGRRTMTFEAFRRGHTVPARARLVPS
ncbi:MAG: methionyl-tRNA formyltransferase [Planctomycetota bacterium]|jgi:methionyl-tRNA formyltransferase